MAKQPDKKAGAKSNGSYGAQDITVAGSLNKPRKLVVTASVPGKGPGSGFTKTVEQRIHPTKAAPLVHLTSDKPAYRPGEQVRLRIACLDRLTLRGAEHIGLRCRLVDPKGAAIQQTVLGVGKGVAAWTWSVPPEQVGGQYALEVRDHQEHAQEVEIEIPRITVAHGFHASYSLVRFGASP